MKSSGHLAAVAACIALCGCVADSSIGDEWALKIWDAGYLQAERTPTGSEDGDDEPAQATTLAEAMLGEGFTTELPAPPRPTQRSGSKAAEKPRVFALASVNSPPIEPPAGAAEWSEEMPRSDWVDDEALRLDD